MRRGWMIVLVAFGCELAEVAQPNGETVIVVQGIMRPDRPRQWVLVEETFTGSDPRQSTPGALPPSAPQLPVLGATVTVENLSLPADPCGRVVVFAADPSDPAILEVGGLYWAPPGCPTMRTGDSLELRVGTTGGASVTGRTQVVGAAAFSLASASGTVALPGPIFDFNRDLDTLRAAVSAQAGRAMQFEIRRASVLTGLYGTTERVTSLFVDSTAASVPGTITDVFDRGTGDFVFHPGEQYEVTISLADDNYFDFVRSSNGEITGRGFINRLDGGIGVFGSVVAASNPVRVVGVQDDPREGRYRMQGTLRGVTIDTEWDVYLVRTTRDSVSASAFVTGDWVDGPLTGTAGLARGFFFGDEFSFDLEQDRRAPDDPQRISVQRYIVRGLAQPGTFAVQVTRAPFGIGSLTVTR